MELKSRRLSVADDDAACSNRTFMELKFLHNQGTAAEWQCSNRTFMELKYRKRAHS